MIYIVIEVLFFQAKKKKWLHKISIVWKVNSATFTHNITKMAAALDWKVADKHPMKLGIYFYRTFKILWTSFLDKPGFVQYLPIFGQNKSQDFCVSLYVNVKKSLSVRWNTRAKIFPTISIEYLRMTRPRPVFQSSWIPNPNCFQKRQ